MLIISVEHCAKCKPMKILELHFQYIQFLLNNHYSTQDSIFFKVLLIHIW